MDLQLPRPVMKTCRKYNERYSQYGFTFIGNKQQCVACSEVSSSESMKPSLIVRHLERKYSTLKGKPLDYFQTNSENLDKQKNLFLILVA
jgi:hypothetical protein